MYIDNSYIDQINYPLANAFSFLAKNNLLSKLKIPDNKLTHLFKGAGGKFSLIKRP